MKEGAARAVLREAWLRGQRCVELQRDGKRTIFVCTMCGTRCYSDSALVDHLRGNVHFRLSAALTTGTPSEKDLRTNNRGDERVIMGTGEWEKEKGMPNPGDRSPVSRGGLRGGAQIVLAGSTGIAGSSSKVSFEWIGSGELFFSVRPVAGDDAPIVDSSWFFWKGKGKLSPEPGWQGGGIVYAVVMFPYSDMIGRGGDGKPRFAEEKQGKSLGIESGDRLFLALPSCSNPQTSSLVYSSNTPGHNVALTAVPTENNSPAGMQTEADRNISQLELEKRKLGISKEVSGRVLRRACKRKKARVVERLCFICHQRMISGKDVAALLNLQTKQMVCGSRNNRGVFHVYHSSCLIDWISICELKTFTGQLNHRIEHTRKLKGSSWSIVENSLKQSIQVDTGPLSNFSSNGAVFCPECQGTGLSLRGAQLEHPRYRLAQVFDWILELIQARNSWADNPENQDMSHCGLLFRDELQGSVQSRGLVHFYSSCAELLTGNALE